MEDRELREGSERLEVKVFSIDGDDATSLLHLLEDFLSKFSSEYIWFGESPDLRTVCESDQDLSHLLVSINANGCFVDELFLLLVIFVCSHIHGALLFEPRAGGCSALAVEGGKATPEWLTPECDARRVYFHGGRVAVVPFPSTPAEVGRFPTGVPPPRAEALRCVASGVARPEPAMRRAFLSHVLNDLRLAPGACARVAARLPLLPPTQTLLGALERTEAPELAVAVLLPAALVRAAPDATCLGSRAAAAAAIAALLDDSCEPVFPHSGQRFVLLELQMTALQLDFLRASSVRLPHALRPAILAPGHVLDTPPQDLAALNPEVVAACTPSLLRALHQAALIGSRVAVGLFAAGPRAVLADPAELRNTTLFRVPFDPKKCRRGPARRVTRLHATAGLHFREMDILGFRRASSLPIAPAPMPPQARALARSLPTDLVAQVKRLVVQRSDFAGIDDVATVGGASAPAHEEAQAAPAVGEPLDQLQLLAASRRRVQTNIKCARSYFARVLSAQAGPVGETRGACDAGRWSAHERASYDQDILRWVERNEAENREHAQRKLARGLGEGEGEEFLEFLASIDMQESAARGDKGGALLEGLADSLGAELSAGPASALLAALRGARRE